VRAYPALDALLQDPAARAAAQAARRRPAQPDGPGTAGRRAERDYRISGDRAEIARSKLGYQVYEYRNRQGELLYVGKSGGAGGEKVGDWSGRLKQDHIRKEWIGEAPTVTVTSELSEQEAFALEEVLIPQAKYNIAPGEYSRRFPQGNLAGSARDASRYGTRAKFRLDAVK
jgi:hypothetical protein